MSKGVSSCSFRPPVLFITYRNLVGMPQTLNCWAQIASFLHIKVKTAQRWEREDGLPIYRAGNGKRLVFAFPAELRHWVQIGAAGNSDLFSSFPAQAVPRMLSSQSILEHHRELLATLRNLRNLKNVQRQQMAKLKSQIPRLRMALRQPSARQAKVEDALAGMGRMFLEAQEQDRIRIARDLHDDINQRLALSAIMIDEVQLHPEMPSELRNRLCELQKQIIDLSTDVHALAHELHPSSLEYLGIVAALRSLCQGLAKRRGIEIKFTDQNVPKFLPSDISHCLFRVLQEALNNAARHSGAKHIEVRLRRGRKELHLIVCDAGTGFDVIKASNNRGLGLTNMRERVRLVSGTLVIRSKPTAGTTIHACVPFRLERESKPTARKKGPSLASSLGVIPS